MGQSDNRGDVLTGTRQPLRWVLSVTSYGVVKDQKHDRAGSRYYYAVQIESRHSDVAEKMEDPSAYDRAHDTQQDIQDNSLAAMVD